MKSILAIIQNAPYANIRAQESFDMILSLAAYEQIVCLLFMNDGVLQLCKNQNAKLGNKKEFTKAYSLLPLYDIENIYVEDAALTKFNLTLDDLIIQANPINSNKINSIISFHDFVLTS